MKNSMQKWNNWNNFITINFIISTFCSCRLLVIVQWETNYYSYFCEGVKKEILAYFKHGVKYIRNFVEELITTAQSFFSHIRSNRIPSKYDCIPSYNMHTEAAWLSKSYEVHVGDFGNGSTCRIYSQHCWFYKKCYFKIISYLHILGTTNRFLLSSVWSWLECTKLPHFLIFCQERYECGRHSNL